MVYTIAPAVRRRPTLTRWALAVMPYLVGSILGGAFTGAFVAAVGLALRRAGLSHVAVLALFIVVCTVAVIRDMLRPTSVLPSLQRQVPVRWRASLPLGYATFLYGVQLGLGWATHVYFGSYYILLGMIMLGGNVKTGLLVHATYGLARGAVVFLFPNTSADRTDARLMKLGRLRGQAGWISALSGALAASVAVIGII